MGSIAHRVTPTVLACLAALIAISGCGSSPADPTTLSRTDASLSPTTPSPAPTPPAPSPPAPPAAPAAAALPLRTPAVTTAMVLIAPTVGIAAPVLAVGQNAQGQMDAPEGPLSSPVWDEGFWYRDGAQPGAPGTATIAGHVDDTAARLRPFARIRNLHPGDPLEVQDRTTGSIIHFHVTQARAYGVAEARTAAVLNQIFGVGAVTGSAAAKQADAAAGVAHLNLITCTGSWQGSGFNQRFVVYAVRDS